VAAVKARRKSRFPGETADYRRARNRLLKSEVELRRQIESVAAQRRRLPLGGEVPEDYVFEGLPGGEKGVKKVRLSALFKPGTDTLFLYNFMYPESVDSMTPCPSCTSIIDGIDGAARHVSHPINFVVVAKAPIEKFRRHARSRGWKHVQLLSSENNSFNADYRAEDPNGQQFPLAHVFVRRGKKIRHFWSSELWFAGPDPGQDMRHVDFIWPVWSILDTTPKGRGKSWSPQIKY
jgi:predicted dithiol-disulfide oxidoreductase (DUF899 family)